MPKLIGLDLHKDYAQGYEWDPDKDVKRHFRIPSDPKAWSRFVENQVDRETQIAIEATGNAFHVHDILSPYAGKVVVADKTRCLNRARAALRGDGYNVPRTMDPWKWVEQHGIEPAGVTQIILESCLRQREALDAEIDALAIELKRFAARNEKARQLMSLPGVGPIVGAALVAHIGDPGRFKRAKQVVRYAGLDASVHQSGEEHWQGRISKNGPPLLRKLLVQAAHQIVRSNRGPLADFYRRKVKEVGHRRAIIALARKLLIAAWRLMQTDRLAHEVQDERTMKGYQRSLRTLERELARAGGDVHPEELSTEDGLLPEGEAEVDAPGGEQSPAKRGLRRKSLDRSRISA